MPFLALVNLEVVFLVMEPGCLSGAGLVRTGSQEEHAFSALLQWLHGLRSHPREWARSCTVA